jgi:drug/metabolite transporter (DMT)-like permease
MSRAYNPIATFAIAGGCALCFSSKGVIAKLAYGHGVDPLTLLTLRMVLAMPLLVPIAWWAGRGAVPLSGRDRLALIGLGVIGYYLSSLLDFHGLAHISAGLERMVLYLYPSLVVLGVAVRDRRPPTRATMGALLLAYAGIAAAFHGEALHGNRETTLGVTLVFASAVSYAAYLLVGQTLLMRVGGLRTVCWSVVSSGVLLIIHRWVTGGVDPLLTQSATVYGHAALLAIACTVVPSVLLAIALHRAGPERVAVIGAIGPLATVALEYALLGERPGPWQWLGFAATIAGGLWISLAKAPAREATSCPPSSAPR